MVVQLQCIQREQKNKWEDGKPVDGEFFEQVTFLDCDVENRMTAFLKCNDESVAKCKIGQDYKFAITGLSPVKEDKSSLYLRGRLV